MAGRGASGTAAADPAPTGRSRRLELIDRMQVEGQDLRRMLGELSFFNRYLGGTSATLATLREELAPGGNPRGDSAGQPLTLLDVAAGGGDLIGALEEWGGRGHRGARRRVPRFRAVGCDVSLPTCKAARERLSGSRAPYLACDAFRLPFLDGSFDVVHCALFLHHVPDQRIPELLSELLRVARLGILVNDLRRHRLAEILIRILTGLFSRSRFIRHDAPLSVQRGFTRAELQGLSACFGPAVIRSHWAFRYLLWIPAVGGHTPAGRRGGGPPRQGHGG